MLKFNFQHRRSPSDERRCATLLKHATRGDRVAFDGLVESYSNELKCFLRRRVSESDVEDVFQETWLSAWNALKSFDGRSRFKTWLYGIALNKCRDHFRVRSNTSTDAALNETMPEASYVEEDYHTTELREVLRNVLSELSDSQREVIELYYFSGLSLPEISTVLARNLNTVKYQFYRAHADAAEMLQLRGTDSVDQVLGEFAR